MHALIALIILANLALTIESTSPAKQLYVAKREVDGCEVSGWALKGLGELLCAGDPFCAPAPIIISRMFVDACHRGIVNIGPTPCSMVSFGRATIGCDIRGLMMRAMQDGIVADSCPTEGVQHCIGDGGFVTCANGRWIIAQACGEGTRCQANPADGARVLCGW